MNFNNIPNILKAQKRWVCWKLVERDGRLTKAPVNARTGNGAQSNNPSTWSDFQTAVAGMKKFNLNGIGFMFGDGFVGVDIDHCIAENGGFSAEAIDIIDTLDSYTEMSQSGKGVHIICRGSLPEGQRRKGNVEMYEERRFFVMTGDILDDAHMEVNERTEELKLVHDKYLKPKKNQKDPSPRQKEIIPFNYSDDELIDRIMSSKQRDLFIQLMNGDTSDYTSTSEADLALCNILAFWTQKDEAAIDRIYRRSGLYRAKWDRLNDGVHTYGQITIGKALADCQAVYNPPAKNKKARQPDPPQFERPPIEIYDQLIPEDAGSLEGKPGVSLPPWIWGPYNDTWNATRLVERHGDKLRHNINKGWLVWSGTHWEEDRKGTVRLLADETIQSLYEYLKPIRETSGAKAAKRLSDWLSSSRNSGRKDNMLKEASHFEAIATLPEQFDKDIYLLNCRNGTIDLRSGKLMDHSRNNLITKLAPVEYNREATAPTWEKFLNRIFDGNQELIRFIQRAIGYSLTGSIKEQCIYILHGTGKNGKSTFLDTIRAMLGSYTKNANSHVFMKSDNQNSAEIARLQGARFVTTTEPEENERLSESLIKQATGGEPLTARFLYQHSFEFIPEFKLWMATNHKPKITGSDLGIWRRIRLIPFTVIIPEEERDKELGHKLQRELSGILNWAIAGCSMWMKEGLKEPKEVIMATESYQNEMDTLSMFISDCIETKEGAIIKAGDLYRAYENWCVQNGEYKMSSTKFSIRLKERGFKQGKSKIMRYWENIQLSSFGRRLQFGAGNDSAQEELLDLPWDD